jgi:hypothetical protein
MAVVKAAPVDGALMPRITAEGQSVLPGEPGYEAAGLGEGRGAWKP